MAINEAPATLIEKAFIVLLLYSCGCTNGELASRLPRENDFMR
jgi:hypothetical protein